MPQENWRWPQPINSSHSFRPFRPLSVFALLMFTKKVFCFTKRKWTSLVPKQPESVALLPSETYGSQASENAPPSHNPGFPEPRKLPYWRHAVFGFGWHLMKNTGKVGGHSSMMEKSLRQIHIHAAFMDFTLKPSFSLKRLGFRMWSHEFLSHRRRSFRSGSGFEGGFLHSYITVGPQNFKVSRRKVWLPWLWSGRLLNWATTW